MGKPTSHRSLRDRGLERVDVYLRGDAARAWRVLSQGVPRVDVVSEAILLLADHERLDFTDPIGGDDE
jgi:hypothetical protein